VAVTVQVPVPEVMVIVAGETAVSMVQGPEVLQLTEPVPLPPAALTVAVPLNAAVLDERPTEKAAWAILAGVMVIWALVTSWLSSAARVAVMVQVPVPEVIVRTPVLVTTLQALLAPAENE